MRVTTGRKPFHPRGWPAGKICTLVIGETELSNVRKINRIAGRHGSPVSLCFAIPTNLNLFALPFDLCAGWIGPAPAVLSLIHNELRRVVFSAITASGVAFPGLVPGFDHVNVLVTDRYRSVS